MKTLGQIAWEVEVNGYGLDWDSDATNKEHWERIAKAVAEECAKVCKEQWYIDGQFTADEFAAAVIARAEVKK